MAVVWGLWQLSRMPLPTLAAPVLSVSLLSAEDQTPAAPLPAQRQEQARLSPPPMTPPAPPVLAPVSPDSPAAPTAAAPAATLSTAPAPAALAGPAAPVAAPASPPAPTSPAPRRQVSASAVRYLSLPPVEVPRAARRAGEHGTVWLRVVVDAAGLPVQVSVQRSSGFARLDDQALWAMRQARFMPHTEDGRAVEVEVIAPIEYPAD